MDDCNILSIGKLRTVVLFLTFYANIVNPLVPEFLDNFKWQIYQLT